MMVTSFKFFKAATKDGGACMVHEQALAATSSQGPGVKGLGFVGNQGTCVCIYVYIYIYI